MDFPMAASLALWRWPIALEHDQRRRDGSKAPSCSGAVTLFVLYLYLLQRLQLPSCPLGGPLLSSRPPPPFILVWCLASLPTCLWGTWVYLSPPLMATQGIAQWPCQAAQGSLVPSSIIKLLTFAPSLNFQYEDFAHLVAISALEPLLRGD